MYRIKSIWFSISLFCTIGLTQPAIEWVRAYGGNTADYFEDIYAVSNGDYVMCGYKSVAYREYGYVGDPN